MAAARFTLRTKPSYGARETERGRCFRRRFVGGTLGHTVLEYVLVFLAALFVGAVVYVLSLRVEEQGPDRPTDPQPATPPAPAAPPGAVYVPLSPATTTWEHRVTGMLGLLVTVTLAGALLAFVAYAGGSMLFRAISEAASNGGVSGGAPVP